MPKGDPAGYLPNAKAAKAKGKGKKKGKAKGNPFSKALAKGGK